MVKGKNNMKKLILIFVMSSLMIVTLSHANEEMTNEEMLQTFYADGDLMEKDFSPEELSLIEKMEHLPNKEFSPYKDEQIELIKKGFLFYLREIRKDAKDFEKATEYVSEKVVPVINKSHFNNYVIVLDSKGNQKKLMDSKNYYIDFDNETLYTSDLEGFVKNDIFNLNIVQYQHNFNRLFVTEPKNSETRYSSVINLGKQKEFTFDNLKEAIEVYIGSIKTKEEEK